MSNTDFDKVAAGMTGAQVAEAINKNIGSLFEKLKNLDARLRKIEPKESGSTPSSDDTDFTVTINALPETTIIESSATGETTCNISLSVKCGNKELVYGNDAASQTSYKPTYPSYNIVDTSGTIAGTAKFVKDGNSGKIQVTFNKSIHGYYSLTFGITYMNAEYKHAVSFNVIENNLTNNLQINFAPSTLIITESVSKTGGEYVYDLTKAKSTYSISLNGKEIDYSNVTVEIYSDGTKNCSGYIDTTSKTVRIASLNSDYADLVGTYTWKDIDGYECTATRPTGGYLALKVTYTDSNKQVHDAINYLSFVVNNVGIFKESIIGDVHTQISEKTIQELDKEGKLITEEFKTEIIQEASGLTLSAVKTDIDGTIDSKIKQTADQVEICVNGLNGVKSSISVCEDKIESAVKDIDGNTSQIVQTGNRISMLVNGLNKTGIDIKEDSDSGGTITLQGDRVYVKNGDAVAALFEDGKIKADYIDAQTIVAEGIISNTINASNATISGLTVIDATVKGSIRSPFQMVDSGFNNKFTDNLSLMTNGGSMSVYMGNNVGVDQVGRLIHFTNYRWGSKTQSGSAKLTLPSGYYFFEDGVKKSTIIISRQCVTLLGLGDDDSFYGWLVLDRVDINTESAYGHCKKVVALGKVTGSSTGASISYYTFDGHKTGDGAMSVTRNGVGNYRISFNLGLNVSKPFVMLTGTGANSSGPIKATLMECSSLGMTVYTSDDESNNDGSFNFEISNFDDFDWLAEKREDGTATWDGDETWE